MSACVEFPRGQRADARGISSARLSAHELAAVESPPDLGGLARALVRADSGLFGRDRRQTSVLWTSRSAL